jgi:hypothetical protein
MVEKPGWRNLGSGGGGCIQTHSWKCSYNIPFAEVRIDSEDLAGRLRKQFASKERAGHDFGVPFWQTAPHSGPGQK